MISISRRAILNTGLKFFPIIASNAVPKLVRAQESYADPNLADQWLSPLIHAPGAVANALHMGRFSDRIYYLDKEIKWYPSSTQNGPSVIVPAGFVTDLASIPRVFWSLLPTDGAYTFPAIVHDFLYWTQRYPREIADNILRYGMDDMKVSSSVALTIYSAVRVGGGSAWENNAALKQSGEMRLLRKFPSDPTVTWMDWKKQKDCCSAI